MQQYDPITINRMIELLPEIERRKRKAKRYRSEQERGAAMQDRPTSGNFVPSQQGGWFPTIQQYQKDYEKAGNQIVGGLTDFLMGRKADREESELASMQGSESLRALDQIQRDQESNGAISGNGGASESALRGFLGIVNGGDPLKHLQTANKRVHSRFVDSEGNNWVQYADGTRENTGIKGDYKSQMFKDEVTGDIWGIGTSGAGRNRAESAMVGGAPASASASAPSPSPGPGAVTLEGVEGLSPQQRQALESVMGKLPEEDAISLLNTFMDLPRQQGGGVASGVPRQSGGGAAPGAPRAPLRMSTAADQAAAVEQAKIGAQLGMADQVTQMEVNREGAKRTAVLEADRINDIRSKLPKLEINVANARATADQLMNHPGLKNITGRLGGMIPDPDAFPGVYQAFKSTVAGTETGNALALYEQMKGKVFDVAFETLRGGGQITVVEGTKAEQAAARMSRAQTTEEFKSGLKDFTDAYEAGLQKLRAASQSGYYNQPPAAPVAPPSAAGDPRAALRSKYGL